MRRFIVIFLLTLLPFQFVWGAAASYCLHEQGTGAKHFGHHEHKHQGKMLKASGETSADKKMVAGDDADCLGCHMGCMSPVTYGAIGFAFDSVGALCAAPVSEHSPDIPYSIERPNWALAV